MAHPVLPDGEAYEGRWSRLVARGFLRWLNQPSGLRWLDVGCGTGTLTAMVLARADPAHVTGDLLAARLPGEADGPVRLTARAWAVRDTAAR